MGKGFDISPSNNYYFLICSFEQGEPSKIWYKICHDLGTLSKLITLICTQQQTDHLWPTFTYITYILDGTAFRQNVIKLDSAKHTKEQEKNILIISNAIYAYMLCISFGLNILFLVMSCKQLKSHPVAIKVIYILLPFVCKTFTKAYFLPCTKMFFFFARRKTVI